MGAGPASPNAIVGPHREVRGRGRDRRAAHGPIVGMARRVAGLLSRDTARAAKACAIVGRLRLRDRDEQRRADRNRSGETLESHYYLQGLLRSNRIPPQGGIGLEPA